MQSAVRSEVAVRYEDSPFDELADALFQMNALSCSVRAAVVELVASMASGNEWSADARSVPDWLSLKLGLSRSEASTVFSVASRISLFPLCFEAFRCGELSWDRLVILSSFVSSAADDEHYSKCGYSMSLAALRRVASSHKEVSVAEADEVYDSRDLHLWPTASGNAMHIKGTLTIDDGLLVRKQLEIRTDAIGPDPETGLYPQTGQAMADALVQVFSEAGSFAGAGPSGAGGGRKDADRATIVVETTLEDLAHGNGGELEGVVAIAGQSLSRLGCDARIQKVEVDSEGHLVGLGRVTRTIPPWLSRRLSKRDQGCRFPGCERTTWTHGHHIVEWAKGGPTNLSNLVTLCGTHHRFVHEKGWHVEGDPGGSIEFVRPDGSAVSGRPPPLRDDVASLFPALRPTERDPAPPDDD